MALSPLARSLIDSKFQKDPLAYRLYSKKHRGGNLNDFMRDLDELQQRVDALKIKVMEIAALQGEKK